MRLATHKEEREKFGAAAYEKITEQATLRKEQEMLLRAYTQKE